MVLICGRWRELTSMFANVKRLTTVVYATRAYDVNVEVDCREPPHVHTAVVAMYVYAMLVDCSKRETGFVRLLQRQLTMLVNLLSDDDMTSCCSVIV